MQIGKRRVVHIAAGVLALATSHAGALGIALTSAQVRFQDVCLASRQSCLYEQIRFSSAYEAETTDTKYLVIPNEDSVNKYNQRMFGIGMHVSAPHLKIVIDSVSIFEPKSGKWDDVKGTTACRYCILSRLDATEFPKTIRISSRYWAKFWRERYPTFSHNMRRDDNSINEIIVSTVPRLTIYAIAYYEGKLTRLSTASAPDGKLRIHLDSRKASASEGSYYVISPLQSWSQLASIYKKSEGTLLLRDNTLPVIHGKNATDKITNVVRYMSALPWSYSTVFGSVLPYQNVEDILRTHQTDCKGMVTVFQAALLKAGLPSRAELLNVSGMTPLSPDMPTDWPNHVIVYIPAVDKYVDITYSIFGKVEWDASADIYKGYTALDVATGKFFRLP